MVLNSTDSTVTLSWMPPDPPNGLITNYLVQYRIIGDRFANVITNSTALTYTVSRLTSNVDYKFQVKAYTIVGRGPPSKRISYFVGKFKVHIYCCTFKHKFNPEKCFHNSLACS